MIWCIDSLSFCLLQMSSPSHSLFLPWLTTRMQIRKKRTSQRKTSSIIYSTLIVLSLTVFTFERYLGFHIEVSWLFCLYVFKSSIFRCLLKFCFLRVKYPQSRTRFSLLISHLKSILISRNVGYTNVESTIALGDSSEQKLFVLTIAWTRKLNFKFS